MVLRLARQLEARFPLWEKRVSIFVMTPVIGPVKMYRLKSVAALIPGT